MLRVRVRATQFDGFLGPQFSDLGCFYQYSPQNWLQRQDLDIRRGYLSEKSMHAKTSLRYECSLKPILKKIIFL